VAEVKLAFRESTLRVDIAGEARVVAGNFAQGGLLEADVDGQQVHAHAHVHGSILHLFLDAVHHVFEWLDPYLPAAVAADRHGGLVAPMPGRVIAVLVEDGKRVTAGTALVVMEAMKMEHTVTAPADGIVADIHCAVGDQVREGDELLKLTPAR
jgi:3-methylcrotonyl-CoA carboxylase alpha subunit